jgi:ribose transport system substrate-binding protein
MISEIWSRRQALKASLSAGALAVPIGVGASRAAENDSAASEACRKVDGYKGVPRALLWSPNEIEFTDTSKYKKSGPYTIGFSNAGLGDSWRVVALDSIKAAIAKNASLVKKLYVTDANHVDAKQVSDIEDLMSRGVDILIVSANTSDALDPVVSRAMKQGVPVIMEDRSVTSSHFVSFATCADAPIGRIMAQWLIEKLNYKGNIIILSGQAGASPDTNRVVPAMQIFKQYPDIKILDRVYSDFSSAKGKTEMAAMIQKYGKSINGVFGQFGGQVTGSIEAFIEAGWGAGEIPAHTSTDYNGPLKLAIEHRFPIMNIDYPPAMGGLSVEVALKTLQGIPVPKIATIRTQITMARPEDETPSVLADQWAKDYIRSDKPNDYLLSSGLGRDYDPATFHVDLP